ncbi:UDP-2,3-diacylglucosamine diphosphatase [Fulvivirgaceae bacterium BMA10]|uniref:UDP-2,3-diacylglucosamine diphosphatase n=1 Tax=Splendidivirga corallicola TaxID=3051826 RepID=A0ABT8KW24_9BACT|nr:UDP-2,3-diacylglucosamine diphosphatase [Fulvivirgaceae bacterium BMA10]
MTKKKREVDIVVISDVHLGTYGCHAKELLRYLKSIKPQRVILNGDIIDIWQFKKRYWPKSHMQVVKYLMGWVTKGVKVYYITGNHDEMLRKFVGFKIGSFKIVNKLVLRFNNQRAWLFHGDVFDVTMQHSKWLAKLGAVGYDMLILLNRAVNFISDKMGKGPVSMSKKIKNSVKSAVKFINNFEQTAADIAISNKYDYVVCGHIHQPEIRKIKNEEGEVTYLNSGDWIENLTALEYANGEWALYRYFEDENVAEHETEEAMERVPENGQLFENLQKEFNLLQK